MQSDDHGSRYLLPADGVSEANVEWVIDGSHVVQAHYLFSWIGYSGFEGRAPMFRQERKFVEELEACGYGEKDWLLRRTHQSTRAPYACAETQSRVTIVEATDPGGGKHKMVSNLIMDGASTGEGEPNLGRWVDVHIEDSSGCRSRISLKVENKGTYREQKRADLANIFCSVVEHCAALGTADYVGPKSTILVHKAMLHAHDKAFHAAGLKQKRRRFSHKATVDFVSRSIWRTQ